MWLTALQKELGGEVSDEKMRDYIWNTLKSGRVRHSSRPQSASRGLYSQFSVQKYHLNHLMDRFILI